VNVVPIER